MPPDEPPAHDEPAILRASSTPPAPISPRPRTASMAGGTRRRLTVFDRARRGLETWTQTRRRRRIAWSLVALAVLLPIGLFVVYPLVGAWAIRHRLLPRLEARLGQRILVEDIDVSLGHATLYHVRMLGEAAQTVGEIEQLDVDFATLGSLVGSIRLQAASLTHVQLQLSHQQLTRVRAALDGPREATVTAPGQSASSGTRTKLATLIPAQLHIRDVSLRVDNRVELTIASIERMHATSPVELRGIGVVAHHPRATITAHADQAKLSSTTIATFTGATISASVGTGATAATATDISGSLIRIGADVYWQAAGTYPSTNQVAWRLQGRTLDRGRTGDAQLLTATDQPSGLLSAAFSPTAISFDGTIAIAGVSLAHPAVVNRPVNGIGFSLAVRGSFDRVAQRLEVPVATLHKDGVAIALGGSAQLGQHRSIDLRITVPPVPCQTVLQAVPPAMIPKLAGYVLAGTFALDLRGAIAWDSLAASTLESTGGLAGCSIVTAPADSPAKLNAPFVHRVEVAPQQYADLIVGGKNPYFVNYDSIPDYVIHSLVETEDPTFMQRESFAAPGMARALLENLRTGTLRVGGSTIPMQLAKNVFLDGKRTLARKLQELFLAWHIESTLPRYRIIEIYLNIIEFGPGIYGIGRATHELFDKPVYELMPVDAAYFSSIVPKPRTSYHNFCKGEIDDDTRNRMQRALTLMVNEGEISPEDWKAATETHVVFAERKDSEADCMARRKQALTEFENR